MIKLSRGSPVRTAHRASRTAACARQTAARALPAPPATPAITRFPAGDQHGVQDTVPHEVLVHSDCPCFCVVGLRRAALAICWLQQAERVPWRQAGARRCNCSMARLYCSRAQGQRHWRDKRRRLCLTFLYAHVCPASCCSRRCRHAVETLQPVSAQGGDQPGLQMRP